MDTQLLTDAARTIYSEMREWQALLAGLLAIAAAIIALRGSLEQARAVLATEATRSADAKRTAAAAIWAELSECRLRVVSARDAFDPTAARPVRMHLDAAIFDYNPAAVGMFPPEVAATVVVAYKMLKRLDIQLNDLHRTGFTDVEVAIRLGRSFKRALFIMDAALPKIATTAGFTPEEIDMLLKAHPMADEIRRSKKSGVSSDGSSAAATG